MYPIVSVWLLNRHGHGGLCNWHGGRHYEELLGVVSLPLSSMFVGMSGNIRREVPSQATVEKQNDNQADTVNAARHHEFGYRKC